MTGSQEFIFFFTTYIHTADILLHVSNATLNKKKNVKSPLPSTLIGQRQRPWRPSSWREGVPTVLKVPSSSEARGQRNPCYLSHQTASFLRAAKEASLSLDSAK